VVVNFNYLERRFVVDWMRTKVAKIPYRINRAVKASRNRLFWSRLIQEKVNFFEGIAVTKQQTPLGL
jgi:hypothetical protein